MTMKRIATVVVLTICSVVAVQAQMGGMGGPGSRSLAQRSIPRRPSTPRYRVSNATGWAWPRRCPPTNTASRPAPRSSCAGQKVQYDGVRTFAQIVTHTIQANYSAFAIIGGIKPDVDTAAIGKLTSKDDIVKALADTFAFAHKAVANVTAANAFVSAAARRPLPACSPAPSVTPMMSTARQSSILAHEWHRASGQRKRRQTGDVAASPCSSTAFSQCYRPILFVIP